MGSTGLSRDRAPACWLTQVHCCSLPGSLLLSFSHQAVSEAFATPWTVARQAALSMGFSRQAHWSGLPFSSPGDLLDPGIEPKSPAWQADSLPLNHQGSSSWALGRDKNSTWLKVCPGPSEMSSQLSKLPTQKESAWAQGLAFCSGGD